MYRVIKFFTDLHDNDHAYHVGDEFPREGVEVSDERLQELSGYKNKQGVPLIEPVQPMTAHLDKNDLEKMTISDLKDLASDLNLKVGSKMTKADIIAELITVEIQMEE